MENIIKKLQKVKIAAKTINNLSIEKRNILINDLGVTISKYIDLIKIENKKDLKIMDIYNPMYDRLLLNDNRIYSIIKWCNELLKIEDPLNKYDKENEINTKEWLKIKKIWVPLGVVACIYESRPNVTIDIITMCIKSWNAVILKGWKEAKNTNSVLIKIAKEVLKKHNIDENIILNFSTNREDINYLYKAVWLVDVIIPRWWKDLIDSVRKNSLIPVIETWAWVVHIYVDNEIESNIDNAINIIINAKKSRPSVCNALDTLIINKQLSKEYIDKIIINLKNEWINHITKKQDYTKEHLSLDLNIKYVNNIEEAIEHIDKYSSKHSDSIITENEDKIKLFYNSIDSSVVYANTSTRFSDWWCFWLGWEIWISTQKLHARWPMWAESLVTYKYLVNSDFKIRE